MSEEGDDKVDFSEELDRLVRGEPFHPFVFVMSSGTRYEVTGPGQSAVYFMSYGYYPPRGPSAIFPFHQISSIELLEES